MNEIYNADDVASLHIQCTVKNNQKVFAYNGVHICLKSASSCALSICLPYQLDYNHLQLWPMKSRKIPRVCTHSRCSPVLDDLLQACNMTTVQGRSGRSGRPGTCRTNVAAKKKFKKRKKKDEYREVHDMYGYMYVMYVVLAGRTCAMRSRVKQSREPQQFFHHRKYWNSLVFDALSLW